MTTGLLDMLNRVELEGVVAHELSHIRNYDILVSTLAVTMVGAVALMADLAIRKQTKGARSIDDGLRAVVAKGGNNGVWWGIDRFLSVCDEATGTRVLRDLYAAWKHAPVDVDLDEIYRRLGVAQTEHGISFDDNAPDAALRRALVSRADN